MNFRNKINILVKSADGAVTDLYAARDEAEEGSSGYRNGLYEQRALDLLQYAGELYALIRHRPALEHAQFHLPVREEEPA